MSVRFTVDCTCDFGHGNHLSVIWLSPQIESKYFQVVWWYFQNVPSFEKFQALLPRVGMT